MQKFKLKASFQSNLISYHLYQNCLKQACSHLEYTSVKAIVHELREEPFDPVVAIYKSYWQYPELPPLYQTVTIHSMPNICDDIYAY